MQFHNSVKIGLSPTENKSKFFSYRKYQVAYNYKVAYTYMPLENTHFGFWPEIVIAPLAVFHQSVCDYWYKYFNLFMPCVP